MGSCAFSRPLRRGVRRSMMMPSSGSKGSLSKSGRSLTDEGGSSSVPSFLACERIEVRGVGTPARTHALLAPVRQYVWLAVAVAAPSGLLRCAAQAASRAPSAFSVCRRCHGSLAVQLALGFSRSVQCRRGSHLLRLDPDGLVGPDRRAARLGDCRLTLALQRSHAALCIDADVRREENEQLARVGHVVQVGAEARLARERQAAEAAQREALLPARDHHVHELLVLVVHLVRADRVRKQRVLRREAALVERARDRVVQVGREHRSREVPAARMERIEALRRRSDRACG
eukprot:178712-Prymnesium_polylepis.1